MGCIWNICFPVRTVFSRVACSCLSPQKFRGPLKCRCWQWSIKSHSGNQICQVLLPVFMGMVACTQTTDGRKIKVVGARKGWKKFTGHSVDNFNGFLLLTSIGRFFCAHLRIISSPALGFLEEHPDILFKITPFSTLPVLQDHLENSSCE